MRAEQGVRVQICSKGACGSMRLLTKPRNHGVSFVYPNWGGAFAADLDTAQQILASRAAYGASVPGSRPS
ncbi:hypothetical protein HMPREF1549_00746 [Actinomyces johnsonii F0510]|uniref:Uncharacterized protein n=1 Tax=Actinomyces johnsonii F0510 TaxID=1227262 RepID=U1RP11_9ACTO|nr:hypothetical protein HMPREF1549_00746 [Actinomyces johnsonii F0510]